MAATAEVVASSPEAHGLTEPPRLVAVPQQLGDDSRAAERRFVRRMLVGILICAPVGGAIYVLLMAVALRGTSAPLTPMLVTGAAVGVFAGLFWGFWFGLAASQHEIEEIEVQARRRMQG